MLKLNSLLGFLYAYTRRQTYVVMETKKKFKKIPVGKSFKYQGYVNFTLPNFHKKHPTLMLSRNNNSQHTQKIFSARTSANG